MSGLLSFTGSPHGGVQRLLPEWDSQPTIRPVGIIDHSQVGGTDGTFLLFRDRSGLESHFSIRSRRSGTRDGLIEQFMSIDRQADANLHANAFTDPLGVRCGYLSVETEDDGDPDTQPWTRAQLDSLKWLHDRLAVIRPTIRRAEAATCFGGGLGFHVKMGAPSCWTPVAKTCPGGVRRIQWEAELLPAFLHPAGEEDDMTKDELIGLLRSDPAVREELRELAKLGSQDTIRTVVGQGPEDPAGDYFSGLRADVREIRRLLETPPP